ncbi:short-chain dehydrogenase [Actibacterium mucosum KCTC 23349]|uniref:Short-chain dehydrogenase n=1 Tax=Actibacterium mucosum KCTC 23349 TaxID=1454373 RepID=A0A037ZKD0_9RHOB|nr:SDR family NAD(P)-dependent oxidoreductase [Actibacterium mucosum]KAJ55997.1 short-chain dehydrogenase [Actibacterium mucosum KCTC 23349]
MHVLITGANRGIGHALAQNFTASGDRVTGTYRGDQPAGDGWQQLDVTDPASHADLAARMAGDPVDLLVCNAGIYLDKGARIGAGFEAQKWADTFAVNVTGAYLTIEALLPNLRLSRAPRIAIISSMMASHERAPGGSYIYRASKAAVLNLGRNLAADLAPEGIAVGIVEPGWVQTDMGGGVADLTLAQSIPMLRARLDAIDMATTGFFARLDGAPHPY